MTRLFRIGWVGWLLGFACAEDSPPRMPPGPERSAPPVARDDTVAIAEDSPGEKIAVLENDENFEDYVIALGEPAHGSVSVHEEYGIGLRVKYSPFPGFHGVDSFSYTLETPKGSSSATLTVHVEPDGIPYEESVLFDTGQAHTDVASGDLSGDGRPDLAVLDGDSGSLVVLVNGSEGPLTFAFAKRQFEAGLDPAAVAVADFDDDGREDVATVDRGSGQEVLLRNLTEPGGSIAFAEPERLEAGRSPGALAVLDANGDGRPDLASLSAEDDEISIRLNASTGPGDVRFGDRFLLAAPDEPSSLAVGDLDADGRVDLAVTGRSAAQVSLYLNATAIGETVPMFEERVDRSTGERPITSVIADLDGDGMHELAVLNGGDSTISIYPNGTQAGGELVFGAATVRPISAHSPVLSAQDLDGDGRLDLFFGRGEELLAESLGALFNHSQGIGHFAFIEQQLFIGPWTVMREATAVTWLDLDGAGAPEVVLSLAGLENDTTGTLVLFDR